MKYTTTFDSVTGINIIATNGTADAILLIDLIKSAYKELSLDKSKLLLFDCRKFTIDNSLTEVIGYFQDIEHKPRPDLTIAMLYKIQEDIFNFIEDAGVNRGWNVKVTNNLDVGIKWLKSQY